MKEICKAWGEERKRQIEKKMSKSKMRSKYGSKQQTAKGGKCLMNILWIYVRQTENENQP